jgi:hypothetical protein
MHYLVVENEDGDYYIEHPDCPTKIAHGEDCFGGEPYEVHTCNVERILNWTGLYDLFESEHSDRLNKPGRYPISAYVYTPSSMFEDAEAFLYFDDPKED